MNIRDESKWNVSGDTSGPWMKGNAMVCEALKVKPEVVDDFIIRMIENAKQSDI